MAKAAPLVFHRRMLLVPIEICSERRQSVAHEQGQRVVRDDAALGEIGAAGETVADHAGELPAWLSIDIISEQANRARFVPSKPAKVELEQQAWPRSL
jgi:hypothetical protein